MSSRVGCTLQKPKWAQKVTNIHVEGTYMPCLPFWWQLCFFLYKLSISLITIVTQIDSGCTTIKFFSRSETIASNSIDIDYLRVIKLLRNSTRKMWETDSPICASFNRKRILMQHFTYCQSPLQPTFPALLSPLLNNLPNLWIYVL